MAEACPNPADQGGERERIALSAVNQYLFCPRRAALIHIEGIFKDNEHTLRGDIVHEHADLSGYEVAKGVLLWRALPVWSERLGLSGKCDMVEVHPAGGSGHPPLRLPEAGGAGGALRLYPVEFKLGRRRQWQNDDAQLCAQALCLEEMFGVAISRGAIFHADSKRRREVEFTAELRSRTEEAVRQLHGLLRSGVVPAAVYREACEECSLFSTCLPRATGADGRVARLSRQLFEA